MRRVAIIFTVLLAAGIGIFLVMPSFIVGFEGGFKWRLVSSEKSAKDRFELRIEKRTAFPATEWLDPATAVRFLLLDATNSQVLAKTGVTLMEDSDFATPKIRWHSNRVEITGFDRRQERIVTLDHFQDDR